MVCGQSHVLSPKRLRQVARDVSAMGAPVGRFQNRNLPTETRLSYAGILWWVRGEASWENVHG